VTSLAEQVSAYDGPGHIVAPAGFGKTHLIAEAVSYAKRRQLVLTHTYAGVNALAEKLRRLRVPTSRFRLDTIASWALRVSLAFKRTSGWASPRPADGEWSNLYSSCANLLEHAFVGRMLRASYAGVFVDEYQDCSKSQHLLILGLSHHLPCRVLGDPMQSIFDFDGEPVNWVEDVERHFARLGRLETPHRWLRSKSPRLGEWLRGVRDSIDAKRPVSLSEGLPQDHVKVRYARSGQDHFIKQQNTCAYFSCASGDSAVAIYGGGPQAKARCHKLARRLSGRFVSIEEVEGRALFATVGKLDGAPTPEHYLRALVEFACNCMTAVKENLPPKTQRGEQSEIRPKTRNPELVLAANACLATPNSSNALRFLTRMRITEDVLVVRGDLLHRMTRVLRKHSFKPQVSLTEAAEAYQAEFRYRGRPAGRRVVATTLLVKGLEFDHAIVLDPGSLSSKELYVALTRGAKSLTIVSTGRELQPWS
jgi:hypothetical protein